MDTLAPINETTLATLQEVAETARNYARESLAENTRRSYSTSWDDFRKWCSSHDLTALPAAPETVGLYLAARAETLAVATLEHRLAAIRAAHRVAGEHFDATHPGVRAVWRGIRRTHTRKQKRAEPIMTIDLLTMLTTLPDSTIGVRDRALLLVGYGAALRRSEIVNLDINDLKFTDEGVVISIIRSKVDQQGVGDSVGIVFGNNISSCPVRSLRRWIEVADISDGALFRSVNRHGNVDGRMTGRAVALIVKKTVEAAGIDPTEYSGHSLRSGHLTQARMNGATSHALLRQARHRSLSTLARYIRPASVFQQNPSSLLGL